MNNRAIALTEAEIQEKRHQLLEDFKKQGCKQYQQTRMHATLSPETITLHVIEDRDVFIATGHFWSYEGKRLGYYISPVGSWKKFKEYFYNDMHLQTAFPEWDADDREFLHTGLEWETLPEEE